MTLINSKKLKNLQEENEELKSTLQRIDDKEDKLIRLEEVIKKVQNEINRLDKQKTDYRSTIDQLMLRESELKNELVKLSQEIDKLRVLKTDEQQNLLYITNHINDINPAKSPSNGSSTVQNKIDINELKELEKRKNELKTENAKLEIQLGELGSRINTLDKQQVDLQAHINKKKSEPNNFDDSILIKKQKELSKLEEKISNLKENESRTVKDFERRIKELSFKERALKDSINLKNKELENAATTGQVGITRDLSTTEDNLISLIVEEQNLVESIKKRQISLEELEMKISSLKEEEEILKTSLESGKKELANVGSINSSIDIQGSLNILRKEEQELRGKLDMLNQTEKLKRELISELNDKLSANEIKFAALENDYEVKVARLEETSIKLRKISGESAYKQKELLKLTEIINDKTLKLKNLSAEITFSEEKIKSVKEDIIKIENSKSETERDYKSEKETINALKKDYIKLKGYLPILENRKKEIQEGNSILESRFKNMFQMYNKELNEANKKKSVLDQIIVKKERDINERDQVLFEKVAALNETERVLKLRQVEISSFEDLLSVINEQTEMLKNDIVNLNDKAAAKKNTNKELDSEAELLKQKISEFEKGLYVLLERSNKRYIKGEQRKTKLQQEIKQYEERVTELNHKIKESMNELVELQESLGRIKIEHEEHRSDISKLVSMKKKMQEEIDKNQLLFEKYTKIKEKIKAERDSIKKRKGVTADKEFSTAYNNKNFPGEKDFSKIFRL